VFVHEDYGFAHVLGVILDLAGLPILEQFSDTFDFGVGSLW
jgi:hypothetical protein